MAKNQMRNSTKTNVEQRIDWLSEVASRRIKIPKQERPYLINLREFCKLSIANCFDKISYNTLKQSASALTPHDNPLIRENGWAALKDLLEQARRVCAPAPTPSPKDPLPPPKEVLDRTLLDAHMCSMAYIELYNFLRMLSRQDIPSSMKKTIDHQLEITTAKFKLIVSHSDNFAPPQKALRVVAIGEHNEN
ncbi:hypothetical protein [Pseudomonas sp. BF-B-25]|uniref:hypothetical protein n=1 Tax=Pseudomonas sp. BF-B-25 TaxID=2832355 RepID=UPI001CC0B257|nr:hypothetical protein [Pseudomonas sp. BF-B-25]